MFANIFIKNRPFFGKMRNQNYQRCHVFFRKIQELSRQNPFLPKDMIRVLKKMTSKQPSCQTFCDNAAAPVKKA